MDDRKSAEQTILRLFATGSTTLKRERSFAFPNYGKFGLYRMIRKNYGVEDCSYKGQRYTTTIRSTRNVEDSSDPTFNDLFDQPKFSSWGKEVLCQVVDVDPITVFGNFDNG